MEGVMWTEGIQFILYHTEVLISLIYLSDKLFCFIEIQSQDIINLRSIICMYFNFII